jgi:hypothetical protein
VIVEGDKVDFFLIIMVRLVWKGNLGREAKTGKGNGRACTAESMRMKTVSRFVFFETRFIFHIYLLSLHSSSYKDILQEKKY